MISILFHPRPSFPQGLATRFQFEGVQENRGEKNEPKYASELRPATK
jgi:hypothetical protein